MRLLRNRTFSPYRGYDTKSFNKLSLETSVKKSGKVGDELVGKSAKQNSTEYSIL